MPGRHFPPGGCTGTYLCAKDEPRDDTVCAYADMPGMHTMLSVEPLLRTLRNLVIPMDYSNNTVP